MTDALQIGLQNGPPGCALVAAALFFAFRIAKVSAAAVWAFARRVWGRKLFSPALPVGLLSVALYAISSPLSGWLEWYETAYIEPVYLENVRPDSAALIELYETEIQRHTSPAEFQIVKTWTQNTAQRIGSTPVAIYEAAYLECGLNPFRVRDDRIAAGWIQLTRTGLSGLNVSHESVIQACRNRDTETIMRLSDAYLARKATKAPEGTSMRNTIDLYLAIFAPAHIGKEPGAVVYAGRGNPAYDKNSGLDGWTVEGGKIVKGAKDGQITVREIWLCLERKKSILLDMKQPGFSKKQLLISPSGSIVFSDAIGANQSGDFCKTFSVGIFEPLPVNYFKRL